MKHPRRCAACKTALGEALGQRFAVTPGWRSGWPCRVDDVGGIPEIGGALAEIHGRLVRHRGFTNFVRVPRLPGCDWKVDAPRPFLVELDESQHFTAARAVALGAYPTVALGFDRERWVRECERVDARDPDPPFRDEQRAWYDALRDLLPGAYGFAPTVRLLDGEIPWCRGATVDGTLDHLLPV